MTATAWLTRSHADVPPGDAWLGPRERAVQAGLRVAKRRADWRAGRWTAKLAVAACLGRGRAAEDLARIEVVAAGDGAPELHVDGARAALGLSLSHRAGRALAVVARAGVAPGCDLEVVEPRSPAFLAEWLAPAERVAVAAAGPARRDLVANLAWTAKEAAAKVRREGLRLDVRAAVAHAEPAARPRGGWRPVAVAWPDRCARGWWREEPGWVMAVLSDPPAEPPEPLG